MINKNNNNIKHSRTMNSDIKDCITEKEDILRDDYGLDSYFNVNIDENFTHMFSVLDNANKTNNSNIKLCFTLCSGSFFGYYHTIIVRGYNLENRTRTIDTILALIPSSNIYTIFGNSKEELSEIQSTHKILHVVNFDKNVELITLLTKANKEGIFYKGFEIPKMTVITDVSFKKIPEELRNNSLIIEASNECIKTGSNKKTHLTYAEETKFQNIFNRGCEKAIEFLCSLEQNSQVDISTKQSIDRKINRIFPRDIYYHKVFLDLIKITTLLNQSKRKSYTVTIGEDVTELRVYISEVEDVKWCFEVSKEIFIKNSLNLPDRYLEMLNFIIGWLTNDPVINESKNNKRVPENWDDYFDGMVLIKDYVNYLQNHEDKIYKKFVRNERIFREYLLHLSDHKKKGKYECLHFIQEENKNRFKLSSSPLIKSFQFHTEYNEFYEEYLDFLQYIDGKRDELSIKLNFKKHYNQI